MSATPTRRMAILALDLVALERLFCLPVGCEIEAVLQEMSRPDVIRIRVRGAGFEVAPGQAIPLAAPGTIHEAIVDIDGKPQDVQWVTWGPDLCPEAS